MANVSNNGWSFICKPVKIILATFNLDEPVEIPQPPRCPKHKTAMIRVSEDSWGVKLQCCLRTCSEATQMGLEAYKRMYGEKS